MQTGSERLRGAMLTTDGVERLALTEPQARVARRVETLLGGRMNRIPPIDPLPGDPNPQPAGPGTPDIPKPDMPFPPDEPVAMRRRIPRLRLALFVVALFCVPAPSFAQVYLSIGAPPLLPTYALPPAPAPNYLWTPGYWAWGPNGYYWVPGTWVAAPAPNLYWTPPYWSAASTGLGFAFNQGFWAPQVGYYGGVNYGAGYYGTGYVGGNWSNGAFMYNTAISPVNTTVIRNVYVNRSVVVNTVNHVSYNGPGGIRVRPTPAQLAVVRMRRLPLTAVQRAHVIEAQRDRALLATVNRGRPPVVAVSRPLSPTNRPAGFTPITAADRRVAAPVHHAAAPAPAHHAAAPAPVHHAAAPAPVHHAAPAPVHHAAPAPVHHAAAPVHHAPPAPVHHAPPAPVHHAPPAPVHPAAPAHPPAAPAQPGGKPPRARA